MLLLEVCHDANEDAEGGFEALYSWLNFLKVYDDTDAMKMLMVNFIVGDPVI